MLLRSVPGADSPLQVTGILGVGAALTLIAVGSSAWFIASSIAGNAAQSHHMALALAADSGTVDAAWANATAERALVGNVTRAACELRGIADLERVGKGPSGQSGPGPVWSALVRAAEAYDRLAGDLDQAHTEAARLHERAREVLRAMQTAIAGTDQTAFATLAADLRSVVGEMGATSPRLCRSFW